jgi:hypothetical protein
VGVVYWGADDTTGLVPNITAVSSSNYITVTYGTHANHSIPSTTIELLMTFSITLAVYKVVMLSLAFVQLKFTNSFTAG